MPATEGLNAMPQPERLPEPLNEEIVRGLPDTGPVVMINFLRFHPLSFFPTIAAVLDTAFGWFVVEQDMQIVALG
jgi:hypothetical protein